MGRQMMKFQCSFPAVFIKEELCSFKVSPLGFEGDYLVCRVNSLTPSLLPVFEDCWCCFSRSFRLSYTHCSHVNAAIPELWCALKVKTPWIY